MARFFKTLILLSLLLLAACQEGGEAGDLFGQWRMKGTDNRYVSFSGSVVLFRSTDGGSVYGNFQHVGDSLFLQCYSIYGTPADTLLIEGHYGFNSFSDIRLRITTLDGESLGLADDNRTWSFYKY